MIGVDLPRKSELERKWELKESAQSAQREIRKASKALNAFATFAFPCALREMMAMRWRRGRL